MSENNEHTIPEDDRPDLSIDLDKPIGEFTMREIQALMAAGPTGAFGGAFGGVGGVGGVGFIKTLKDSKDWFDKGALKDAKDAKDVVDVIKRWVDSPFAPTSGWPPDPRTASPMGEVVEALSGLREELKSIHERLDRLENEDSD